MGHSYNAAVWAECRKYAVEFLKEARRHLGGNPRKLIDDARVSYEIVSKSLENVHKMYPFSALLKPEPLGVDERTSSTVEELKRAKEAEEKGLRILTEIVNELE